MKKFLLLILSVLMFLNLQAQSKMGVPTDAPAAAEKDYTQTVTKINSSVQNRESGTFSPRTIEFVKNHENGLRVEMRSSEEQLPILIKGDPSLMLREGDDPAARSFNFLENAKGLMKINNPTEEFRVVKTQKDELGFTHVKLQQEINGISIYGSEVIYHYNESESFLNGRHDATVELDSYVPSVKETIANDIAVADVGGITEVENDNFGLFDFEKLTNELVIYKGKLAYRISVYKNIVDLWEYFVDANTGEILYKFANMCKFHNHDSKHENCAHDNSNFNITSAPVPPVLANATDLFGTTRAINSYEINGTFYMIDANKDMFDDVSSNLPDDPVGAVWTIDAFFTSPANNDFEFGHVTSGSSGFSQKNTAVSAQYNGGQAYLYFENVHGRESINGQGGNVIGLINIIDEDGSSLGNAFWNGIAMFYGNGDGSFEPLARGLDVAGHEMSHGVIQSTANLMYQGESGALNESFADVFGAMIDREDWLIGEDVVKSSAFPSGALRSLEDPHNGAPTGDFNRGWQPKVYSERFTGSQDNGGVHINSGIPNHAYYLFATSQDVGMARAEKVYYRALDVYLTMSSQFIDARLAVVQAAQDLYGTNVANKAKAAFDAVEIFDGNGGNNQTDVEVNPGADLILFTTESQNGLYIFDKNGDPVFDPLTQQNPISVPSITDDGTEIVFVNQDKELYYIRIDWENNTKVEGLLNGFSGPYRNVVFSRDGLRMASLFGDFSNPNNFLFDNEISIFDWVTETGTSYSLFNPSTIDSISTEGVLLAEAMQFDFSGEYLMYDAFNSIPGTGGNNIDYWDINFIKVFNNSSQTFTLGNDIQKLFSQIPEGKNIGNPTFSKNSDYIIAFDYFDDIGSTNFRNDILGVNIETVDLDTIFFANDRLGFPSYSNQDDNVIFNGVTQGGRAVIGNAELESNKIRSTSAEVLFPDITTDIKWGVWFGNGDRVISDVENELPESAFEIYPNPANQEIQITTDLVQNQLVVIRIADMMGRAVYNASSQFGQQNSLDISPLAAGQYVLTIITEEGSGSKMFVKQ